MRRVLIRGRAGYLQLKNSSLSAPDPAPTEAARIYYDRPTNALMVSVEGNEYQAIPAYPAEGLFFFVGQLSVQNTDPDVATATFEGAAAQVEPILAVQDSAHALLFGISGDGDIQTARTSAAATPGSVVRKLEIFDAAGVSLGFVPIYDAIT